MCLLVRYSLRFVVAMAEHGAPAATGGLLEGEEEARADGGMEEGVEGVEPEGGVEEEEADGEEEAEDGEGIAPVDGLNQERMARTI